MRATTEAQLLHTALNPKRKIFPKGVFLSFMLSIPGSDDGSTKPIHIAVHRNKHGTVGTVIPNHIVPIAGSNPLPTPVIVSAGIRYYVKRKLAEMGIPHIDGLIAEDTPNKGNA